MPRRSYAGAAPATTLSSDITASTTSITAANGTGYPTGSAGPFYIVLDPGKANEEKVLVTSRSGNVLTCTVGNRGADGTAAATHSAGAVIQHVWTATDADEANAHINGAGTGHTAASVTFTPAGTLSATDVQAALVELDSEKATTGHSHAAGTTTKTFRIPHTFALSGNGSTLTAQVIPGFFVSLPAGQTATLHSVRYVGSSTATAVVRRNAATLETLSVTSTATTEATGQALADNDYIDVNLTASASSTVSVTVFVDYTVVS